MCTPMYITLKTVAKYPFLYSMQSWVSINSTIAFVFRIVQHPVVTEYDVLMSIVLGFHNIYLYLIAYLCSVGSASAHRERKHNYNQFIHTILLSILCIVVKVLSCLLLRETLDCLALSSHLTLYIRRHIASR